MLFCSFSLHGEVKNKKTDNNGKCRMISDIKVWAAGMGARQVLPPARLSMDSNILQVSAYIGVLPMSGPRTKK